MKRSEMVTKLEEFLETIPVSNNGSYYEDADSILEFLEGHGLSMTGLKGIMESGPLHIVKEWDDENET